MATSRQKTASMKESFLKIYSANLGFIADACEKVGIGRDTYYHWVSRDKEFQSAVLAVDQSFIDLAECRLKQAVRDNQMWAIKYLLENRCPEKWKSSRTEGQQVLSGSIKIEWCDSSDSSDDASNKN